MKKKKHKKKKSRKSKSLIRRLIIIALAISMAMCASKSMAKSDDYIRHRVVRLKSAQGMCSGEQVRAPSGKDYILSAAHCMGIADANGVFNVIDEDGNSMGRKLIAEDPDSDLILLEGLPGVRGLDIAQAASRFQHVRTFTHGHNFDTYTTEGVLVQESNVTIPTSIAIGEEAEKKCISQPKYRLINIFGPINVCALSVDEQVTTAVIVPGSSGGPIVDDKGRLIGVASATGEGFSYLVRLSDIQRFLANA